MSSHICPVFRFNLSEVKKHPDADRLGIFSIPDTQYNYVLNLSDWQDRDNKLVSWIIPDSLVNTLRPEFDFLVNDAKYDADSRPGGFYARVKARKLRGVVSFGLLVPAPEGLNEGDDGADALGVVHYNKPEEVQSIDVNGKKIKIGGGEDAPSPSTYCPDYDLENFRQAAKKHFVEGEEVIATEKINGENFRVMFDGEKLHVGSHHRWKRQHNTPPNFTVESLIEQGVPEERARQLYEDKVINFKPTQNSWWETVRQNTEIKAFCRANPNYCLYGEKTKKCGKMSYNLKDGQIQFYGFDILTPEKSWMNFDEARDLAGKSGVKWVPEVYRGPFDIDKLIATADFKTTLNKATHIAEGVVVQPVVERSHERHGRSKLKIVSTKYLEGDFE